MEQPPLGIFPMDLFAEVIGSEGVLAHATIGGREVVLVADLSSPVGCMNGMTFQPVAQLRVCGGTTAEQAINVDVLHEDYFKMAPPPLDWLDQARGQLTAWRTRMDKRLGEVPPTTLRPWPKPLRAPPCVIYRTPWNRSATWQDGKSKPR